MTKQICDPCSKRGRFLLGVDPSLTSTGWALFSLSDAAPLAAGNITSLPVTYGIEQRLEAYQEEVRSIFERLRMGVGDVLVCEGPAHLSLDPQSSLKVERVRSMFETLAREFGVEVPGRLNPRTIQVELLGLWGQQLSRPEVKRSAQVVVQQLYGNALESLPLFGSCRSGKPNQDIVDAILVGTLAVSRVRQAEKLGINMKEVFKDRITARSR